MTKYISPRCFSQGPKSRKIEFTSGGGDISSDGSLIFIREFNRKPGLPRHAGEILFQQHCTGALSSEGHVLCRETVPSASFQERRASTARDRWCILLTSRNRRSGLWPSLTAPVSINGSRIAEFALLPVFPGHCYESCHG